MQAVVESILANYEVFGEKKNKNILILHGWGRNLQDWRAVAENLSSQYRVILLDLPGHGGSGLPPSQPFDTGEFADFVLAFIKKLELKEPILLGHSFGGKVAVVIASKSNSIKRLFLVDASGIDSKSVVTRIKNAMAKYLKKMPFKNYFISLLASSDYQAAGGLLPSFKKIVRQNVIKEAKSINIPSIIIWGENDKEVTTYQAKRLHQLIRNSILRIIWGAGHHPHLEKPDKFINLLNEYL